MKAPLSVLFVAALFAVGADAGITVPGTSCPWLAGQPDGTTSAGGDSAPAQSPVLVSDVALVPGTALTFIVSGSVNNSPGPSGLTPDGGGAQGHGAENGIGATSTNINALIGVFLDDSQPANPAPPDFSNDPSAAVVRPGLRQPFFIGDGLTGDGSGERQQFVVPAGATRLFLGTMDGFEWNNNSGSFDVEIESSCVAPPGAVPVTQWSPNDGGNGHYYAAMLVPDGITWQDAKIAALTLGGHLATNTSAAENDLVFSLVGGDERFWYHISSDLVVGPWLGGFQPDGSPEPDGGWRWVTGEDFSYTNWAPTEPDNGGNVENKLHFFSTRGLIENTWNDVSDSFTTHGYVAEFDRGRPRGRGLVAWWPGDDDARDIWSGNNGYLVNSPTFTTGKVDRAFNLNGINQYVYVPANPSIDVGASGNGFTVDAWIYVNDDDVNPIIEWSDASGNYGVQLWAGYGCFSSADCSERGPIAGALYANIVSYNTEVAQRFSSSTFNNFVTAPNAVPLNQWAHVALTYSPNSGLALLYVNGVQVAGSGFGFLAPVTDLPFHIGARPVSDGSCDGAGCFFGGSIDEVDLFDRALTAQEIMSIFGAGSGGKCKPGCVSPPNDLVAWWPGDGNTADVAGGNNNATLQGNVHFSSAMVDRGFDFTTGGGVDIADAPSLRVTTFTVDLWVKGDTEHNRALIYRSAPDTKGGEGSITAYGLFADGLGRYEGVITDANDTQAIVYANAPVKADTFQHVALTYDGSTLKIYVDGELSGSTTTDIVPSQDPGNIEMAGYPGVTDEVEIFNRALSPDEIMSIFAAHSAGKCKPEQSDVEDAFVNKNETFVQTSTADPVPPTNPFDLVVGVDATGPNNVTSASFTPPQNVTIRQFNAGNSIPLNSEDGISWSFSSESFPTQGDLDNSFPDGDYAFDIRTAHTPFELTPVITIDGSAYPPTPKVQNTDWSGGALRIDPSQNYTLIWNTFLRCESCGVADRPGMAQSAQVSDSTISLRIEDESGNVVVDLVLTPFATEHMLPANMLSSGHTYRAQLQFANLTDGNESDVQLSAQHATITKFDIVTGETFAPGPVSAFYITAGQQGTVAVAQVASLKFTFTEHHAAAPGQYAIAVLDTMRIMGAFQDGNYTVGSEYTLNGAFTGRDFPFVVERAGFWDGASDGTHNYAVDYNNGGVYRFDTFWGNAVKIFNTAKHYLGITFDTSNNTLWLSQWDNGLVEHRSLNGQLLSSFSLPFLKPSCLALDPADGTLWMGSQTNLGNFYQFKQDGTPISTRVYPQLANLNTLGGEFRVGANSSPSPGPNGPAPRLAVKVSPPSVREGSSAVFTITASAPVSQPLVVTFKMSGKAKQGSDYNLSPSGTVATIPTGATFTTVVLNAIADHVPEKTEAATLTLQSSPDYTVSKKTRKATVKITNAP